MPGLIFRNASRLYLLSPEKRVSLNNSHMKSTAINISPTNWRAFYLNWSHRACGAAEGEEIEAVILYSASRLCIFTVLFKSSVSCRKCCSIDINGNSPQLQCRVWIALWWRPFRVVVFLWISVIAAISTINAIKNWYAEIFSKSNLSTNITAETPQDEICSEVQIILLNLSPDPYLPGFIVL